MASHPPFIGYDSEDKRDARSDKGRCVGGRCYPNYAPAEEDDWTLDVILLKFWRKYPYFLLSIVTGILVLIITTIFLCGRQVFLD